MAEAELYMQLCNMERDLEMLWDGMRAARDEKRAYGYFLCAYRKVYDLVQSLPRNAHESSPGMKMRLEDLLKGMEPGLERGDILRLQQ